MPAHDTHAWPESTKAVEHDKCTVDRHMHLLGTSYPHSILESSHAHSLYHTHSSTLTLAPFFEIPLPLIHQLFRSHAECSPPMK